jgi:hypothetical protein
MNPNRLEPGRPGGAAAALLNAREVIEVPPCHESVCAVGITDRHEVATHS